MGAKIKRPVAPPVHECEANCSRRDGINDHMEFCACGKARRSGGYYSFRYGRRIHTAWGPWEFERLCWSCRDATPESELRAIECLEGNPEVCRKCRDAVEKDQRRYLRKAFDSPDRSAAYLKRVAKLPENQRPYRIIPADPFTLFTADERRRYDETVRMLGIVKLPAPDASEWLTRVRAAAAR